MPARLLIPLLTKTEIKRGDKVVTFDGVAGVVRWVGARGGRRPLGHDDVEVVHPQLTTGRGPWVLHRTQVTRI